MMSSNNVHPITESAKGLINPAAAPGERRSRAPVIPHHPLGCGGQWMGQ